MPARLRHAGADDQPYPIGNGGGQFAAQGGPDPGVAGVLRPHTESDARRSLRVRLRVRHGRAEFDQRLQHLARHGNAPGSLRATQSDRNVEYQAVAGGPVFSLLQLAARPYLRSTHNRPSMRPTGHLSPARGGSDPAGPQDGATAFMPTYSNGGPGGPVALSYSSNGGKTFSGPGTLNPNSDTGVNLLYQLVNPAGQGWAVWADNGSVYAQSFQAADAVSPPRPPPRPRPARPPVPQGRLVPVRTAGETHEATILAQTPRARPRHHGRPSSSSCSPASKVLSHTVSVAGGVAAASAPVTAALSTGKLLGGRGAAAGTRPTRVPAAGLRRYAASATRPIGGSGSPMNDLTVTWPARRALHGHDHDSDRPPATARRPGSTRGLTRRSSRWRRAHSESTARALRSSPFA